MRDDLMGALIFSLLKKCSVVLEKQNCMELTVLAHSILRCLDDPEGLLGTAFQICVTDR